MLSSGVLWGLVVVAAVVLALAGIAMIRLTAKLPELIRACVAVIGGGLLVIFAGFRVIAQLNVPQQSEANQFGQGFDLVPVMLQTSLMTGVLLLGYLGGTLFAERRLTRENQKKTELVEVNG